MNQTDPTKDFVDKNATNYVEMPMEDVKTVSATNDPPRPKPRNINHKQLKKHPKIGRNDICPCGSGKKYKKCHLLVQRQKDAEQRNIDRQIDELTVSESGSSK